eukprot:TRINITY_DN18295_c0_g1_i1.p2 TRINITY_DN18295_c0_g1~~TRINITY_DN18295_c0_g1_i1.p2  ORF type:complete len:176 (+),score=57.18 TRINITY_DN18295_c0_g1_i1:27-554(+)
MVRATARKAAAAPVQAKQRRSRPPPPPLWFGTVCGTVAGAAAVSHVLLGGAYTGAALAFAEFYLTVCALVPPGNAFDIGIRLLEAITKRLGLHHTPGVSFLRVALLSTALGLVGLVCCVILPLFGSALVTGLLLLVLQSVYPAQALQQALGVGAVCGLVRLANDCYRWMTRRSWS